MVRLKSAQESRGQVEVTNGLKSSYTSRGQTEVIIERLNKL